MRVRIVVTVVLPREFLRAGAVSRLTMSHNGNRADCKHICLMFNFKRRGPKPEFLNPKP